MKIKILIIFLIFACFMTGCGKKSKMPEEIKALMEDNSGKTLRVACYGGFGYLNPITHKDSEYSAMIGYFIHAAPLRKTVKGDYVPCLFNNYNAFVDGEGRLIVEGEWHENIKWHDGKSFSASDLQFTFNTIADKMNESPFADIVKDVISLENSDNKCKVVFKNDSRRFMDLLTVGLMPSHLSEKIQSDEYNTMPVGLGPYKIVKHELGNYVILEQFEDFIDGYAAKRSKNVIFKACYNLETMLTDLRNGRYDWAGFSSLLYEQLKTMGIEDVQATGYLNNACVTWLFNTEKPELKDVNIRRALNLLVNRSDLINNYGSAANQIYASPLSENNSKEVPNARQQALDLLKKAGIDEQHKLKLSVLVSDYNITGKMMAEKISSDLKQYNIDIDIEAVSWGEFVTKRLKTKKYVTAIAVLYLPPEGNWVNVIGTDAIAYDSINVTGCGNAQIDQALKNLDSVTYSGDKKADISLIANYLDSEVPMAFLVKPYDISLRKGKAGLTFKNNTLPEDVLDWSVLYECKQ